MSAEDGQALRRADARRRKKKIFDELAGLPREHEALEYAMAEFGTNFDLEELKKGLAARRSDRAP
jgi:hypothetical protein